MPGLIGEPRQAKDVERVPVHERVEQPLPPYPQPLASEASEEGPGDEIGEYKGQREGKASPDEGARIQPGLTSRIRGGGVDQYGVRFQRTVYDDEAEPELDGSPPATSRACAPSAPDSSSPCRQELLEHLAQD